MSSSSSTQPFSAMLGSLVKSRATSMSPPERASVVSGPPASRGRKSSTPPSAVPLWLLRGLLRGFFVPPPWLLRWLRSSSLPHAAATRARPRNRARSSRSGRLIAIYLLPFVAIRSFGYDLGVASRSRQSRRGHHPIAQGEYPFGGDGQSRYQQGAGEDLRKSRTAIPSTIYRPSPPEAIRAASVAVATTCTRADPDPCQISGKAIGSSTRTSTGVRSCPCRGPFHAPRRPLRPCPCMR